ncbi:hypothetical protein [Fusobacterium sp.]|nr:hypothetical protein [Fusobacterium sp.]
MTSLILIKKPIDILLAKKLFYAHKDKNCIFNLFQKKSNQSAIESGILIL